MSGLTPPCGEVVLLRGAGVPGRSFVRATAPQLRGRDEQEARADRVVLVAAAIGVQQPDVARMLGISEKTLRRAYRRELAQGLVEANTRVARRLFELAVEGEPRIALGACCFWLKTRGGWREQGEPISVNVAQAAVMRVPMTMDAEAWDKLAREHQSRILAAGAAMSAGAAAPVTSVVPEHETTDFDIGLEPRRPRRATNEPLWYCQPSQRRH